MRIQSRIIFAAALCAVALSASAQSFGEVASATLDALQEASAQSKAPSDIKDIFAKAKAAADDNDKLNLCGFYTGMSAADAQALVSHYTLKDGEWGVEGDPVYKITLSLKGVRRVTKGGNTFDELAQTVANRVGSLKQDWETKVYNLKTIDGITVTMSESSGFSMFDVGVAQAVAIPDLIAGMIQIPGTDYKMGKYGVTQVQWEAVMGKNPSSFKGANNPVERVSWDDCQAFIRKLNALPAVKKSGLTFRLPTDAEWEVACRAGATGDYCLLADGTEITEETLGQVAWFEDNSDKKTHPVGQKKPNAFGLYDMHGNVWEWCQEEYGEVQTWAKGQDYEHNRVYRGGSWDGSARRCESSGRYGISPSIRFNDLGFRLCASGRAD